MSYNTVAKAAAEWWVDKIKQQCHTTYPQLVAKDGQKLVVLDGVLAENLSVFKNLLTDDIQHCLENHSYLCLTCYYFPNLDLSRLARKAKIPKSYFPAQAQMQICGSSILVSCGDQDLRNFTLPTE